ncbi:putative transposase [Nitrosomonas marina]|uniref:Putative transposase n=1 Tax=Nitrosomonas marina TaxID=917 RepID=A0A1I0C8C4_9PROT|nr:transposase [Nitrosomonas marina]SET15206.1 putative transposase [Nitrosomonas marina]
MRYRRANVKGGTYFFTVNLAERHLCLLTKYVDALREAVRSVKQRHPFYIDAFVVLPDHLHAIWTPPEQDADFATRWMLIKAQFSRRMPKNEHRSVSRKKKGERGIWQRRYWEHMIRNDNDYARHVDYIHFNPVKHGYVDHAVDWAWSSIHRYIAAGVILPDWGWSDETKTGEYGER